jgi:hypothetical protein
LTKYSNEISFVASFAASKVFRNTNEGEFWEEIKFRGGCYR